MSKEKTPTPNTGIPVNIPQDGKIRIRNGAVKGNTLPTFQNPPPPPPKKPS